MVFDFISFNIDEVLSFNSSANVFVFVEFEVHHKEWLDLIDLVELIDLVNSQTNNLTHMNDFLHTR